MRTRKRKRSKWMIICRVGSLVAVNTKAGLAMRPMTLDAKPHYFPNLSSAMLAISNNKVSHSLQAIETKEW